VLDSLAEICTIVRTRPVHEVVDREPLVLSFLAQQGVNLDATAEQTLPEALALYGVNEDYLVSEMIIILMGARHA
jgi:hypothetical protein